MNRIQDTHLYQEIHEQPAVLQRLLASESTAVQDLVREIRRRDINMVMIAARGTSDNAARYARYVLGAYNGLTVTLAMPSLYTIYQRPPRLHNALVLGISQSGQSPDIVAVLADARRQGALTAAFTNTTGSPLAEQSDFVVDIHAGPEKAVAATKTYTASLGAVALLSAHLAGDSARLDALQLLPAAMQATLAMNEAVAQAAPRYRYMNHCVVIGRGFNYATAYELAHKLKELTYVVVEPYSSADFQHGPLAMLNQGFPVIVLAPGGQMDAEMETFIHTIQARRAEVIAISDLPAALRLARVPLPLPASVPEWLSPLTTIIPGQLLALHLAATRDLDVDEPRAIQKVTETR